MDINITDLKKLFELNQKGLISDEVLAAALNERYLKEEKQETAKIAENGYEIATTLKEKNVENPEEENVENPEEENVENPEEENENSEYSFKKSDLVDTKLETSNFEFSKAKVADEDIPFKQTTENENSEYSFKKSDLVDTKLETSKFVSPKTRIIDDINKLGDEVDPELGNVDKAAENVTKPETDTKFDTVQASPERMEKLKNSKKSAFVKGLKILGVVAAASLLLATGTNPIGLGIAIGGSVFSYNYFAKKIREGTWEPRNSIEKFMKYSTEKIMNLGTGESKVR